MSLAALVGGGGPAPAPSRRRGSSEPEPLVHELTRLRDELKVKDAAIEVRVADQLLPAAVRHLYCGPRATTPAAAPDRGSGWTQVPARCTCNAPCWRIAERATRNPSQHLLSTGRPAAPRPQERALEVATLQRQVRAAEEGIQRAERELGTTQDRLLSAQVDAQSLRKQLQAAQVGAAQDVKA